MGQTGLDILPRVKELPLYFQKSLPKTYAKLQQQFNLQRRIKRMFRATNLFMP